MMNTAQAHAHRNNLFCLLAESRLAWMGWLTVLALCCVVLPAPGCYSYLHRLELQTSRWVRSSECFDAALPRMEDDWTEILMKYCYLLFAIHCQIKTFFSLRNLSIPVPQGDPLRHLGQFKDCQVNIKDFTSIHNLLQFSQIILEIFFQCSILTKINIFQLSRSSLAKVSVRNERISR